MEEVSNMRLDVLGKSDGARIDVALKVSGNSMMVRHHDSMAYGGLLRQNLANPLIEITSQHGATLAAFLLEPAGRKDVPKENRSCQLCITVYGLQEASRYIGEILDHAGIYLQHPTSYDPTVTYINPHYLVRPGGTHPAPALEEQAELPIRPSTSLSIDQQLKGNVIQMINNSAEGPLNYLKTTPSPHIRTTLKP